MKKKFFVALVVAVLFGITSAFAKTGLGVQAGYTVGNAPGGAVTFKLDSFPAVFAVNLGLGNEYFAIGGTADWWIQNPNITGPLNWYYGVGLAAGVGFYGDDAHFEAGVRALIGLNAFFIDDFLELYLQAAWQPTLVIPGNPRILHWFSIPVNLGIRFWF